jgi:PAS domain S-box-containing protein
VALDWFQKSRPVVITVIMASLLAWLAVSYRRRYELELEERNKELERTRDFLSSIIRDSAEGIVTLDINDRITSWNRAAERIFGWQADEVIGSGVALLIPDDPTILEDRKRVGERVRAGEIVHDHETTRIRKDGKQIAVRISWSPLYDEAKNIVGVTGILLDITAQQEMRQRLVERERLAAVGEMAAHVAHEIRNPLAGIRGACEVLFTNGENATRAKEISDEVLHQIDRLNMTVSELLEFAARRPIAVSSTDLEALVDRVTTVFQEDPASREVHVERVFQPDMPRVEVDARQLEQVFYNLLLNAAQAMHHQGSVVVETRFDNGQVEVLFRDTGPGLPHVADEKLFQPFFTTRTEGTGLGLAIARKIVHAHGGTIEASTLEAGGAEFRIRLPASGQV